jgi:hypothetical protein
MKGYRVAPAPAEPPASAREIEAWIVSVKIGGYPPSRSREMAEILARRFACPPQTHAQIANVLGVTRERVRQLEAKGLRLLRSPRGRAMIAASGGPAILRAELGQEGE